MELWQEIFYRLLQKDTVRISFRHARRFEKLFESECYRALRRIKEIIDDTSLEDAECFMKIEEIVCTFEALGSSCGGRHDFG